MDEVISRQAAIDAIEKYNFNFPEYMERFVTELRDAMKEDLKEDIAELPSAQPEQRWIPCSERLPELNSRCVLLYGNNNISGGYYRGNRTFDVDYGDEDVKTMVIAWMPLPEPWKGDPQ